MGDLMNASEVYPEKDYVCVSESRIHKIEQQADEIKQKLYIQREHNDKQDVRIREVDVRMSKVRNIFFMNKIEFGRMQDEIQYALEIEEEVKKTAEEKKVYSASSKEKHANILKELKEVREEIQNAQLKVKKYEIHEENLLQFISGSAKNMEVKYANLKNNVLLERSIGKEIITEVGVDLIQNKMDGTSGIAQSVAPRGKEKVSVAGVQLEVDDITGNAPPKMSRMNQKLSVTKREYVNKEMDDTATKINEAIVRKTETVGRLQQCFDDSRCYAPNGSRNSLKTDNNFEALEKEFGIKPNSKTSEFHLPRGKDDAEFVAMDILEHDLRMSIDIMNAIDDYNVVCKKLEAMKNKVKLLIERKIEIRDLFQLVLQRYRWRWYFSHTKRQNKRWIRNMVKKFSDEIEVLEFELKYDKREDVKRNVLYKFLYV